MVTVKRHFHWLFSGIVLLILATYLCLSNPDHALAAGPVDSSSSIATLGVRPGTLTVNLSSIYLASEITNGGFTTTTYQLHMALIDSTGTGNGWSLALASALPSSADVVLTQVDVACASNSTCTLPQSNIAYPNLLQGSDGMPTPILNATANSGMGAMDITTTLTITSPANANITSLNIVLSLLAAVN